MSRTKKAKKTRKIAAGAARGAPRKAKTSATRRKASSGQAGSSAHLTALLEGLGISGKVPVRASSARKPRPAKGTFRGDAATSVPFKQAFDFGSGGVLPLALRTADPNLAFYTSRVDQGWLAMEVDAGRKVLPDLPTIDLADGRKLVGLREGQQAYLNGSSPGTVVAHLPEEVRAWDLEAQPARSVIQDVIARFGAPAWLAAEARRLARLPGPLAPALGVGLLGRLWSQGDVPAAEVRAQLLEGRSPGQLARGWWRALEASAREAVEASALDQAGLLLDGLSSIDDAASSDRALARGLAARWLDDRDDLQSVAWLMAPDGAALGDALAGLDREAVARLALLADLGVGESPRRSAASWMEPEAWWAGVR